jgi:hypothetical protein
MKLLKIATISPLKTDIASLALLFPQNASKFSS